MNGDSEHPAAGDSPKPRRVLHVQTSACRDWWEILKAIAIAVAALVGAAWVVTETYINLVVKREMELAQLGAKRAEIEIAQKSRIPSLEFKFTCEGVELATGGVGIVINVDVSNPGLNVAILDLGALPGYDDGLEEFSELILQRVGMDEEPIGLDYLRLKGDTKLWTRILVDAQSTKRIPFLFAHPKPGVYHVEFRARLSEAAKNLLMSASPGTFDPSRPIWWAENRYIDFMTECGLSQRGPEATSQ